MWLCHVTLQCDFLGQERQRPVFPSKLCHPKLEQLPMLSVMTKQRFRSHDQQMGTRQEIFPYTGAYLSYAQESIWTPCLPQCSHTPMPGRTWSFRPSQSAEPPAGTSQNTHTTSPQQPDCGFSKHYLGIAFLLEVSYDGLTHQLCCPHHVKHLQ